MKFNRILCLAVFALLAVSGCASEVWNGTQSGSLPESGAPQTDAPQTGSPSTSIDTPNPVIPENPQPEKPDLNPPADHAGNDSGDKSGESGTNPGESNTNPGDSDKNKDDSGAGNPGEKVENPPEENCALSAPVPLEAEGIKNFYQVSCELYRSGQPIEGGLNSCRAQGIKSMLSFQMVNLDTVFEEVEHSGLVFYHVPMSPYTVDEANILDAMKVIRDAPKPIVVHCLHGSDRTGTVVAFYRMIFENWSREKAKAEMTETRFGYHEEFQNLLDLIDSADLENMKRELGFLSE